MTIKANILFRNLFSLEPDLFRASNSLKILVVGAGTFPSFSSLINTLRQKFPHIDALTFTLIDPMKSATDHFKDYFDNLSEAELNNKSLIRITIFNIGIKEYLQGCVESVFDLVFYEHPDLWFLQILLAKIGLKRCVLEVSLRDSIPNLRDVVASKSVIIASLMSKYELVQMKVLLNFGLNIQPKLMYSKNIFSEFGRYQTGLIGTMKHCKPLNNTPEKLAEKIRKNDGYFSIFVMASFIIFCITPAAIKVASFLFLVGQLFYHRYGMRGVFNKIFILLSQIFVIMLFLNFN